MPPSDIDLEIKYLVETVDFTLVKPNASLQEQKDFSEKALKYKHVCLSLQYYDSFVFDKFSKDITIAVTSNFPHGNLTIQPLGEELKLICSFKRIDEIDIVLPLAAISEDNFTYVRNWCESIRRWSGDKILKGIIEVGYWSEANIVKLVEILDETKFDYVKTCTGYGPRNVSRDDFLLIRQAVDTLGHNLKIKVAGGIRTLDQVREYVGVHRIGTSTDLIEQYFHNNDK